MVRKKHKKKNANESPDPFNPIVSPSKTKQAMSYNNILPKRAYLLESPEEDQKTSEWLCIFISEFIISVYFQAIL